MVEQTIPVANSAGESTAPVRADEVAALLEDAQLVALFGQRTGQLPDGSLQSAIVAVRRKIDASDEEIARLQAALNASVKSITPVTLLDLKGGWNPFSRTLVKKARISVKNTSFIVFAFLLIIAASVTTFVLNSGNAIVSALEDLRTLEPQKRIGELQRQLLNAQPVNEANTPEAILAKEAYFRTLDDLRAIDQQLSLYDPLSKSYQDDYQNPLFFARNIIFGPDDAATGSGKYSAENIPCELAKGLRASPSSDPFRADGVGKMFSEYQLKALDLSCFQGLAYQPAMVPSLGERLGKVNRVVSLYALWILPAIYGALGATIFFMRSILDPLVPDPPLSRISLRVALGALGGIILGWFWTPDNALGSEVTKIGFSLFGLSFIAGFSIDVFFAMLDRFVNLGRDFFARVGATVQSPETGAQREAGR